MLNKYKLLDLSRIIVGPYASMVLSDFGVNIIKVQSLDGDPTRKWGPPWSQGTSTYFQSINRNKKSITLDFTKKQHREVLYRMSLNSDAIIQNFIPGTTKKLGIDYETIKKYNEKIVYCSISGYGDLGSMKNKPAFDNIIQAETGFMHLTGAPNTEPFKLGFAVSDVITGLYASNAILAGLLQRQHTGKGIHMKTSLYECGMASLINQGSNYLNGGVNSQRMGNHHPNIVPYGLYKTKDIPVLICVGTEKQYQSLLKSLNLQDKEQFNTNQKRVLNRDSFNAFLNETLKQIPAEKIIQKLLNNNVPCAKVNDLENAFNSQIAKELQIVKEVEGVKYVRSPIRNQSQIEQSSAPPKLNEHGRQILEELGYSCKQIDNIFKF